MTLELHSMQSMADVSIVGAAGYTGQETLDRVLGHPSLRLVAAGSDSLAGQPGGALDPRLAQAAMPSFVPNDEALAHDADVTILCLSHEAAAAIEPPATGVSPAIARPIVVFPEPLSPTRPRTSPGAIEKLTRSTARKAGRRNRPGYSMTS